jgi:hypothetical protein
MAALLAGRRLELPVANTRPRRGSASEASPIEPAKAMCRTCVVIDELDYALANGEKSGIWGGTRERERPRLRRERREAA